MSATNDLARRIVRPDVLEMPAYQVPDATGLVKLDAMENPYRLPESLRDELGRRLAALDLNRYPVPSYTALKAAIAATQQVPAGFDLLLGNGSDEIIAMLSQAVARPGACILAPMPGFVMYAASARLAGVEFVGVPLKSDFSLDLPAMSAAIARHKPALVWLAWPNNPTGNCFDEAVVAEILRIAPGLVVLDEAYQPFAQDSWLGRLPEHDNLAVMRTASKVGLAGLRLGWLAGAPGLVAQLDKVRPPYNVNVLTEAAACFALEHHAVLDAQADRLRGARRGLYDALARMPGVQPFPSRANFILFRVEDAAGTFAGLKGRGVLIKDVSRQHPLLAGCLRVTVGSLDENRAFLQALAATLGVSGDWTDF